MRPRTFKWPLFECFYEPTLSSKRRSHSNIRPFTLSNWEVSATRLLLFHHFSPQPKVKELVLNLITINLFTFVFLWIFSQARMNKDESSFINEVVANSLSSDIFLYLDKTIFQFEETHLAIEQHEEDSGRGALCRLSPAGGKAQPRGVPACHRLSPAAPKITKKS